MAKNSTRTVSTYTNTEDDRRQIVVGYLKGLTDNNFLRQSVATLSFTQEKRTLQDAKEHKAGPLSVTIPFGTDGLNELWEDAYIGDIVAIEGIASHTSNGNYFLRPENIYVIGEDASEEDKQIVPPVLPKRSEKANPVIRQPKVRQKA